MELKLLRRRSCRHELPPVTPPPAGNILETRVAFKELKLSYHNMRYSEEYGFLIIVS